MAGAAALASGIAAGALAPWWGGRTTPSRRVRWGVATAVWLISLAGAGWDSHWRLWNDGFVALGCVVAVVDARDRIIPNRLVALTALWTLSGGAAPWAHWLAALETGGGIFLFYLVIHLLTRGGLGMGDVKYGGALGVALGWPAALAALAAGVWAAGIYALYLLVFRKKRRTDAIALGPFLAFGGIIGILERIH